MLAEGVEPDQETLSMLLLGHTKQVRVRIRVRVRVSVSVRF